MTGIQYRSNPVARSVSDVKSFRPWRCWFLLATLFLASCTGQIQFTDRYGRTFDSAREVLEAAKSENERILESLDPLSAPIGEAVTIIVPTLAHIERTSEELFVGPESERQSKLVREVIGLDIEYRDYIANVLPRQIERRNIFRSVDVIRKDTAHGVEPQSGGYLLWFEDLNTGDVFHMKASGETDMQTLPDEYMRAKDESDATLRLLNAIEEFVRNHQPTS